MICIRRLRSRNDLPFSWVMFSPSRKTSPAVGATRRRRSHGTVDLPLPDSPTSPRVRPAGSSRLTPSTARRVPCRPPERVTR